MDVAYAQHIILQPHVFHLETWLQQCFLEIASNMPQTVNTDAWRLHGDCLQYATNKYIITSSVLTWMSYVKCKPISRLSLPHRRLLPTSTALDDVGQHQPTDALVAPVVTCELGWVKFGSGPPDLTWLIAKLPRRFPLAGTQTEAKIRPCRCESTPKLGSCYFWVKPIYALLICEFSFHTLFQHRAWAQFGSEWMGFGLCY